MRKCHRNREMLTLAAATALPLAGGAAAYAANTPIALTSGSFNYNTVVTSGTPGTSASTVGGNAGAVDTENGITFWASSYNASGALPASGTPFTSASGTSSQFQFQSYTANNTLLINADQAFSSSPNPPFFAPTYNQTGALTLSKPASYTTLAVLYTTAGQNYYGSIPPINYTLTFSDGTTYNNGGAATFTGYSWSDSTQAATSAYRTWVNPYSNTGKTAGNSWYFHEADITIPTADATKNLTGISFFDSGSGYYGNSGTWAGDPNSLAIYALSGSVTPTQLSYQGSAAGHLGSWDTTSANFVNTANTPPTTSVYYDGAYVTFDDSATGPTTVNIAAVVSPTAVVFNNSSKSYSLTGAGIGGFGTVTLTGPGTVTFNNSNTYTGVTNISAGTLVIAHGGAVASSSVIVAQGATLSLTGGGLLTSTALNLTGAGTVGVDASSALTDYGGTFAGTLTGAGTVAFNSGTFQMSSQSAFNLSAGITIGSATTTGTLVVNYAGVTAGIVNGTPVTATIFGSGSLGAGALIGADSTTTAWAGKVAIGSGGAVVSGGASGTFTLLGVISGASTSPVGFSANSNSTTVLSAVNTYAGQTQILSPAGSNSTLQLGINNAINPVSGLNLSAGAGTSTFDLNGHAVSLAYLSGSKSTSIITNTGSSDATLTINTGGASYSGAINDGAGRIILIKSGTGTQILTGTSTYSGGTTITAGKLGAYSSTALGSGPVRLSGGTLSLGSAFTLNGSATQSGSALTLTDGGSSEAGSAFANGQVMISDSTGFTASYTYQASNVAGAGVSWADGLMFVLQSDSRGASALGGNGNLLGFGAQGNNAAITPSAGIALNLYSPYGAQTFIATNGDTTDVTGLSTLPLRMQPADTTRTSGDPIQVTLVYSGTTLTETLNDAVDGSSFTTSYPIDLAQQLGGSAGGTASAYLGFTGSTGGSVATQTVSNFSFTSTAGTTGAIAYANNVVGSAGNKSGIELTSPAGRPVVQIGTLSLESTSTITVTTASTAAFSHGVLITSGLSIAGSTNAWTGSLDLTNNDLVVQNGSLTTITNQIRQGYNLTGGANWKGNGITSSTAAGNSSHLTALGVILNSSPSGQLYGTGTASGLFDGSNPGSNDVLVRYTYFGDANLDGKVDGSDYSLIDAGYASGGSLSGWYNGDFNYDGKIDGSDYALIDNAFNNQGVSLSSSALVATSTAQVAPAAVPEPASLAGAAMAGLTMIRRRRR